MLLMRRFVKTTRLLKETVKAAYKLGSNNGISNEFQEIGTVDNVKVYLNDEFMRANGLLLGLAGKFTDCEEAIVVDTEFLKMSKIAQDFIIKHELGHIRLAHIGQTNSIQGNMNNRKEALKDNKVCKMELEADRYAFKMLGSVAIEGLQEVHDFMSEYTHNLKELNLRLDAMKRNYN